MLLAAVTHATGFWHLGADVWTAIATWVAALVALAAAAVAGTIGLGQLNESREMRRAEYQPYVVVLMEESAASQHQYDLVIRNTGRTPAWAITVSFSHPLDSANLPPGYRPIKVPSEIAVLVPGQEWRTYWDYSKKRDDAENLPAQYTATVRFRDSRGQELGPYEYTLDWNLAIMRTPITVNTLHDGMGALKDIARHVKQVRPS